MRLDIKLITDENGRTPSAPRYATSGSAAMDLCAFIGEPITLMPMERKLIKTGIAIALPTDYAAFIMARSGMATKHGIAMANGSGLIDSDYRGELLCSVINLSNSDFTINDGDRIAQLLILPIARAEVNICEVLSETARGDGGFGSTGKR